MPYYHLDTITNFIVHNESFDSIAIPELQKRGYYIPDIELEEVA